MAKRPWVVPSEVIEYTEYNQVRNRSESKLRIDISRAEQYVISYTNNCFDEYDIIPDAVRTAVILIAEAYAYNACSDEMSGGRRLKSESFDDYSYTSDGAYIDIGGLDVDVLLEPFVKVKMKKGIYMRMRKL